MTIMWVLGIGQEGERERDSASVCLLSHWATALSLFFSASSCAWARFGLTHYDAVLPDVDVGTDLRCVDHAVLLDEDVVADVQREERHSARTERKKIQERKKAQLQGFCPRRRPLTGTVATLESTNSDGENLPWFSKSADQQGLLAIF